MIGKRDRNVFKSKYYWEWKRQKVKWQIKNLKKKAFPESEHDDCQPTIQPIDIFCGRYELI